jgi:hypothetical protein
MELCLRLAILQFDLCIRVAFLQVILRLGLTIFKLSWVCDLPCSMLTWLLDFRTSVLEFRHELSPPPMRPLKAPMTAMSMPPGLTPKNWGANRGTGLRLSSLRLPFA